MNYRISLVTLMGAAALFFTSVSAGAPPPLPRFPFPLSPAVSVVGAPGNRLIAFAPKSFTVAQLAAMTQTPETVTIGGNSTTESGPLLSAVLALAGFTTIGACSNDEPATGSPRPDRTGRRRRSRSASRQELRQPPRDPLAQRERDGARSPAARRPERRHGARDISAITNVTVGRAAPQLESTTSACNPPGSFTPPVTAPPTGTVTFNGDIEHPVSLNYDQLCAMPQVSQTDTFMSGNEHEGGHGVGPTLFSLVAATEPHFQFCRANDDLNWYAEVTSSEDGFAVIVSWAEIDPLLDGTQSLLSLQRTASRPTSRHRPAPATRIRGSRCRVM